jgi:putative N6-adenine-specific DNA methylase
LSLEKISLFATCPRGLEKFLFNEIRTLDGQKIKVHDGGVSFNGTQDIMYSLNLTSRYATRILKRLSYGQFKSENDLYQSAMKVKWDDIFSVNKTIKVSTTSIKTSLKSIDFVTLKIKDAICDVFNQKYKQRPNVDVRDPDIKVHLFLEKNNFIIYIDSSGKPLYQRGYRQKTIEAPLKENLAAGIITLSGWDFKEPLLDPMCGSGTLPIEAAMMALNIYPGMNRTFGFNHWHDFDKEVFHKIKVELKEKQIEKELNIYASDIDRQAFNAASTNIDQMGLKPYIRINNRRFETSNAPNDHGVIVCNPPYGVRLEESEKLRENYQQWGSVLKKEFSSWRAYFISNDMAFPKGLRLSPSKKTPLFNGALDCRLFEFVMVSGSNRKLKQEH